MQKVINYSIWSLLFVCLFSCKSRKGPAEYINYVNKKENGLLKISQIDGWEFCIQYKPYDYIALIENRGHTDNNDFIKRKSDLRGTAWFNIAIKRIDHSITPLRYGITSKEEYDGRLNYFLNEASKDIRLIYDKDTLHPASYLFENNYNLTPQETMIVGFYLPQGENTPQKNMQLSFVDRSFKTGIIKAEFSEKILSNIPQLVY